MDFCLCLSVWALAAVFLRVYSMDFCLCLSVWAQATVFLWVYYIHLIYQGEQTWGKLPCAQIAERLSKTREDKSKESLPCAQSLWFLRKTVENKSKKSLPCTQLPWILINTRENKSEEILSYTQSPRIQSTPSRFTLSSGLHWARKKHIIQKISHPLLIAKAGDFYYKCVHGDSHLFHIYWQHSVHCIPYIDNIPSIM